MMYQIKNLTRNQTLVERGRLADSFWTRLKGLLGVRRLEGDEGLLITATNSIHTHFMSIPIDVLYIDAAGLVVDMDRNLPPWRFAAWRRRARHVIELPAGALTAPSGLPVVAVGDQLGVVYAGKSRAVRKFAIVA